MIYYGGNNLPAKLRSKRRRAAKIKSLKLNGDVNISVSYTRPEKPVFFSAKPEPISAAPVNAKKTAAIKPETTAKREKSAPAAKEKAKAKANEEKPTEKKTPAAREKTAASEKTAAKEKTATKEKTTAKEDSKKDAPTVKEKTTADKKKAEKVKKPAYKSVNGTFDKTTEEVKTEEVVAEQHAEVKTEEVVAEQPAEVKTEEVVAEQHAEVKTEEVVTEQPAEVKTEEEVAEQPAEVKTEEVVAEQPAEVKTEEVVTEQPAEVKTEEEVAEQPAEVKTEEVAEQPAEVKTEEVAAKNDDKFKLDATENADILSKMATKRGRKLIYAPKEAIYEITGIKIDVDGKKNDKGVKVKDILEAEIKEGLKLGYLDKYDGLKTSEIKEEYENDTVWEIAEQEFKKMGLLLDGDKIKVYVFDYTGTGCHHIGYIPESNAAELIPYLKDMDKYSFDLDGIITGGKSKTVIKDPKTGKITITKGKDGNYGVDLDVTIINRKD